MAIRSRKHGSYGQRKVPIRYAPHKGKVHPISKFGRRGRVGAVFSKAKRKR